MILNMEKDYIRVAKVISELKSVTIRKIVRKLALGPRITGMGNCSTLSLCSTCSTRLISLASRWDMAIDVFRLTWKCC